MTTRTTPQALSTARTEIDQLDDELVRLLARRVQVVRRVGELKGSGPESPLLDTDRERHLLERWTSKAEASGVSGYLASRVLREILAHSRRTQEASLSRAETRLRVAVPRVAIQGEVDSYSDLAARKLFGTRSDKGHTPKGCRTFRETVHLLLDGKVDYAFLPIENSVVGSIGEVNRLLAETEVSIVDEETWEVGHVLASLPGAKLEDIRHVRSHPVALAQCGTFLGRQSHMQAEPWHDTAGAAESVVATNDSSVAAICSEEAARHQGLSVLESEIGDQAKNITRFVLVALEPEPAALNVPAKTSLMVTLDHREGALARCLTAFAKEELNLTRIESRPQADTPWQYMFFVDVEGHAQDEAMQRALNEVRAQCNLVKVMGTYPQRIKESEHLTGLSMIRKPGKRAPAPEQPVQLDPSLPLAARGDQRKKTIVRVGNVEIGGDRFVLISGPCAVESRDQILAAADMVKRRGATLLRGGAFKPRSSPYSFQGLGEEGLRYLREAGDAYDLPVVTEVMRIEDLPAIAASADVVQVGARNMQNFSLLRELGRVDRPVLLKRGMSATVKELLMAAEYIMAGGNQRVILCERGIRTFETATRSTLDVGAVAVLKSKTHLPVLVDPSHAAGVRHLVVPLALAAAAAGADGLIVEAHPDPDEALCDKEQALRAEDLDELVAGLDPIVRAKGRTL